MGNYFRKKKSTSPAILFKKIGKTKNAGEKGEIWLELYVKMRLLWQFQMTWRDS